MAHWVEIIFELEFLFSYICNFKNLVLNNLDYLEKISNYKYFCFFPEKKISILFLKPSLKEICKMQKIMIEKGFNPVFTTKVASGE